MRRTEFGRGDISGLGQCAKCFVAPRRAFENRIRESERSVIMIASSSGQSSLQGCRAHPNGGNRLGPKSFLSVPIEANLCEAAPNVGSVLDTGTVGPNPLEHDEVGLNRRTSPT